MQAQQNQTTKFFDLHTAGLGYANRLRLVSPNKTKGQKFKPFWALSIAALVGDEGDIKYAYYDVSIKGEQAKDALDVLKPFLVDAEGKSIKSNKVLIGFRIGDAIPEVYQAKDNSGQPVCRVTLKGRLLKVVSAKVNGEVIDLPKTEYDEAREANAAPAEAADPATEEGEFAEATEPAKPGKGPKQPKGQ